MCDWCENSTVDVIVPSRSDEGEGDLGLCSDCYQDWDACPCGCDGDDSKCVYRHWESNVN